MKLNSLIVSFGVMALSAACGGGGGGGGGDVTANPQQASSTVTSTSSLQSAIGSMNGQSAGGALQQIGGAASSIVTPSAPATGAMIALNDVIQQLNAGTAEASANRAPGDCLCDASGNCVFEACGGSGYTLDGTIMKTGDSYAIDVHMSLVSTGVNYEWDYDGTVTISATTIDGDLSGNGVGMFEGGGQSVTFDFNWDVHYNAIMLDGAGCAVGGSMDASVDYSVSGTSAGNYSGDATVTFGPTCGAATAS